MFKIFESTEGLHTWLEMQLFSDETMSRTQGAEIILVPDIGIIEGISKAFKPDTKSFYKFAMANKPSELKIEILENEGELNILNFHSHEIWLPNLYIKNINLMPAVMELVNQFVSEKQMRNGDTVVNFNLRIQKHDGVCKVITFKGSIDELNDSVGKLDI